MLAQGQAAQYGKDIQQLLACCLGVQRAPKQRRSKGVGAFYSITIPGAKKYVPGIIAYAHNKRVNVQIDGQQIAGWELTDRQPSVSEKGLVLHLKQWVMGNYQETTFTVPWVNQGFYKCCSGEWGEITSGVYAKVMKGEIIPQFSSMGNACKLIWKNPVQVKWNKFLVRRVQIGVKEVTVGAQGGTVTPYPWGSVLMPDLVWGD